MPIKNDPGKKHYDNNDLIDDKDEIPSVFIEQFGEKFSKELFNKEKLTEPIKEVKVNRFLIISIYLQIHG